MPAFLLKLYHKDQPARLIDARPIGAGKLTIGRDAAAEWKIDNPERDLSRIHCAVEIVGDHLTVSDMSTNGVLLGRSGARLPQRTPVPIGVGEHLHLGGFIIVVEAAPAGLDQAAAPTPASSPFTPPPGLTPRSEISRPAPVQPFASALRRDVLSDAPSSLDGERSGAGVVLARSDVWQERREAVAGDWNAANPSARRDHTQLIGSPRDWREPPKIAPEETAFGFDAPFHRPILEEPRIPREALVIPSDWDLDARPNASGAFAAEAPAEAAFFAPASNAAPMISEDAAPRALEMRLAEPAPAPPTLQAQPPSAAVTPVSAPPSPAASAAELQGAAAREEAARLLAAFCEGARLDPAELAGEDAAEVLRRAGEIYQQMVLGLSDLLGDRVSLKNEYRMIRTTVRPDANNPFKWVPPRRVAVELLRGGQDGYLAGPAAVRESCEDLKKHLLCVLAGMRAAFAATLKTLSPVSVTERLKTPAFSTRGHRSALAWQEYGRVFTEFQRQADDSADSKINVEFRAAYEKQLRELDDLRAAR